MPNDFTSYSSYNYNRADFQQPNNYAEDMSKVSESINMQFEKLLQGKQLSFNLEGVGVYSEVRDADEDRLMKTMFRASAAANSLGRLQNAINNPGVENSLRSSVIGPDLEYISPDNGDQFRKFGLLIADGVRDEGFRKVISTYTLGAYRIDASQPSATAIPVPADPYNGTTELFFDPTETGFFSSGVCECRPLTGNCANGYRTGYIIKARNFDAGSATIRETFAVQEVKFNPRGDGGVSLVIKRGLGRRNPSETAPSSGIYTFDEGTPVALEVGDIILFGNVKPTTQCLPDLCCVKASPRVYSYCSTTERFIDCVYQDRPSNRMIQTQNMLPWHIRSSYEIGQQMRDNIQRIFNTIMTSTPNYAAGQRRPIDIPGTSPLEVEYNNCDVVPFTMRGIFPTIEAFGQKMSHYFTSCNDTCGQYKIGRLFELLEEAMQGSNVYRQNGWMWVGDVKPLKQYSASKYAEIARGALPNTVEEALKIENLKGASFTPNAKSLLGNKFDANNSGVTSLRFGDRETAAMHDTTLKALYKNTIWWMNLNGFTFFAPDHDALNTRDLGWNPYLPATSTRGKLAPTIYTQNLVPTFINGSMEYKTKDNCGLNYKLYMEFGVHPKAEYLPWLNKFTYGSIILSPDFDPAEPEGVGNEQYIYSDIEALDCGCATVENAIADSIQYFNQVNRGIPVA
jgi:hypothetical protein